MITVQTLFKNSLIFTFGQSISLLVCYYRWVVVKLFLYTTFSTARKFQRIMNNKCFIKSGTYFLLGKLSNFCFENLYYEKTTESFSISLPKTFVTVFTDKERLYLTHLTFPCSKASIKTLEKSVQYVQS